MSYNSSHSGFSRRFSKNTGGGSNENSWAISYGDVVTLLLVFFIILASAAEISSAKLERLKKIFKGKTEEITSIEKLQESLKQILTKHDLNEYVQVTPGEDGVRVVIKNTLLFTSGSAKFKETANEKLVPILKSFHELPQSYRFSIEGHTDDVPIHSELYPSNWHLSTGRALSMLDLFLLEKFNDKRLRVQGFADQKPMFPNKNKQGTPIEENRKRNRRVVIRVF